MATYFGYTILRIQSSVTHLRQNGSCCPMIHAPERMEKIVCGSFFSLFRSAFGFAEWRRLVGAGGCPRRHTRRCDLLRPLKQTPYVHTHNVTTLSDPKHSSTSHIGSLSSVRVQQLHVHVVVVIRGRRE